MRSSFNVGSAAVNRLRFGLGSQFAIERKAACDEAARFGLAAAGHMSAIAALAATDTAKSVRESAASALKAMGVSEDPTIEELFGLIVGKECPRRAIRPLFAFALEKMQGRLQEQVPAIEKVWPELTDAARVMLYDHCTKFRVALEILNRESTRFLECPYPASGSCAAVAEYLTLPNVVMPPSAMAAIVKHVKADQWHSIGVVAFVRLWIRAKKVRLME